MTRTATARSGHTLCVIILATLAGNGRTLEAAEPLSFIVTPSPLIGSQVSIAGTHLNDNGDVVGVASTSLADALAYKPWLWHVGVGIVDLAPQAGLNEFIRANHISNSGVIVGTAIQGPSSAPLDMDTPVAQGLPVPFNSTWQAVFIKDDGSGSLRSIPGLGTILGETPWNNDATSINTIGDVVGGSVDGGDDPVFTSTYRAYLFDHNSVLHDLSGIGGPGTIATDAVDINESGLICGNMGSGVNQLAFTYDPASQELNLLSPMDAFGAQTVDATAINDNGQVVGAVYDSPSTGHTFDGYIWDGHDQIELIGPYYPLDINNAGDIVAVGFPADGPGDPAEVHAHLRTVDGTWHDLDALIGTPDPYYLWSPRAINNQGQIVAVIQYVSQSIFTEHRTVLLTPGIPDAGDVDIDGDIDLTDYVLFAECLAGPDAVPVEPTFCEDYTFQRSDLDHSGHVDLFDLAMLTRKFGG